MTTPTPTVSDQINDAFVALMADYGVPTEMLTVAEGDNRYGSRWTRLSLDLPDGTCMRAYNDDTDVVVQVLTHSEGYEMSTVRLSNAAAPVLLAVLGAIVDESLRDEA